MQYKIDIIVKLNKLTQIIFKNNDIIIILYLIVLFVY